MPLDILVGTQWGDEGKGRVVDMLAGEYDLVARFNGGDNAGHTVTVGERTFKLHLVPSGVIHPQVIGLLGNGMLVNPFTLLDEMHSLQAACVPLPPGRLRISFAAHIITAGHRALDQAQEALRSGGKIGTTGRGIGPAYTDRAARTGLRMQDLLLPTAELISKARSHFESVNRQLELLQARPLDAAAEAELLAGTAAPLAPYIDDTSRIAWQAVREGKTILAEGAQGLLLDLDFGTYPFVTSSAVTAAGALTGLGLGICLVGRVIGVTKAFQTRVGAGAFPTEVEGEMATRLRGTGSNPWDEFGTTTGRPRRVGWLDGVLMHYALRLNGITELVLTKLDVLSGLDEVKVCTAYRSGGQLFEDLPLGPADLAGFEPVYETLPGWQADLMGCRAWSELPGPAQDYVRRVAELAGVRVSHVSVGPERGQVVAVP